MKKLAIAYLFIVFVLLMIYSLSKNEYHEVVKIVSATSFYVDFNDNKVADINELVVLDDINISELNLSKSDVLRIEYLAKEFAKNKLSGNSVKVVGTDIFLPNGSNYRNLLAKEGYELNGTNIDLVKQKLEQARKINLVAYNNVTQKYHKLDCKYVFDSPSTEIVEQKQLSKSATPCKLCYASKTTFNNYPRNVDEPYKPLYKDSYIEFYITDFTKQYYPSKKCLTTACKSLLKQINKAQETIDFAVYGVDGEPEIVEALINAQKRGVVVRWVYDTDKNGKTIYNDSTALTKIFTDFRRDIDIAPYVAVYNIKDAIMHNKFFIFDNQTVWTGSANISLTDLSGFNANSVILINSADIAKLYKSEFEKMYKGYFHTAKSKTMPNQYSIGASVISVYFSPQDKIIEKHIIPLLDSAKEYIYLPVFVITHKSVNNALVRATKRGVDVRLIVDATLASAKYSSVKFLRLNGIKVKVENRAGKMHMKSIIADDKVVVGSMNFTKNGELHNDENLLFIKNKNLANAFKAKFLYFWDAIPNRWLVNYPQAESLNSINSCYDGIDNDFDGKIDNKDSGCFVKRY